MSTHTVAIAVLLPLLLAAGASADLSPDLPEAVCESHAGPQEISGQWAGVATAEQPSEQRPGYAEVFEFRVLPQGPSGRAVVALLSKPGTNERLWPGETRTWVVVAELESHVRAVAWENSDSSRPGRVLVYRPERRRFDDLPRQLGQTENPRDRVCRLLGFSDLASRMVITGHGVGKVESKSRLRRILEWPHLDQ